MSKLVQSKRSDSVIRPNGYCICVSDNTTIISLYHTNDSLSYHVCRCNYCKEEWAEYWISYRYIFSSLISARQQDSETVSDESSEIE